MRALLEKKEVKKDRVSSYFRGCALRTCSKSPKQESQEGQMNELQAGIEQSLAVLP
jgi:hypothetical protein